MATGHKPVLLEEAVAALQVREEDTVVDATFGGGGHTRRILEEIGPDGTAAFKVTRRPRGGTAGEAQPAARRGAGPRAEALRQELESSA